MCAAILKSVERIFLVMTLVLEVHKLNSKVGMFQLFKKPKAPLPLHLHPVETFHLPHFVLSKGGHSVFLRQKRENTHKVPATRLRSISKTSLKSVI